MTAFTQSWRVSLIFGALIIAACAFVSQAYANETDIETLEMQVNTLQTGLQLLQEPLLTSTATSTNGASPCVNGTTQHKPGAVIGGLTLKNGFTSTIRGFQYRCTNGRWIFERVQNSGSSTTTTTTGGNNSGTTSTASTSAKTCKAITGKMYKEGDRVPSRLTPGFRGMPRNKDKDEDPREIKEMQSRSGKWVPVIKGAFCRLSTGATLPQGATTSHPFRKDESGPRAALSGARATSTDNWERFGPYTCVSGTWVPKVTGCQYNGVTDRKGTGLDSLRAGASSTASSSVWSKFTCRNNSDR